MLPQERHHYFYILDAFRFIAFFRIFLLHLSFIEDNSFFNKLVSGGEIGVDFFFVLSGFLITYLLIKEKQLYGKVDAKKYLARRALRIWPLYFLGVAIAYTGNYISAVTGTDAAVGYQPKLIYSLTFLENYQMIVRDSFPSGVPLRVFWSLCVEEHFYIIWLLLFTLVPLKHLAKALLLLWASGVVYRILFYIILPEKQVFDTDVLSKMDYFCCGGLAGYLLCLYPKKCKQILNTIPIYGKNLFLMAILFLFFFHQFLFNISRIGNIIFPVFSSVLLASTIVITTFDNYIKIGIRNILCRLGRISYGLYVYHTIVIVVLMKISEHYEIPLGSNKTIWALFLVLCFIISVSLSILSYRYFEKYFLLIKQRSVVNLTDTQKEIS